MTMLALIRDTFREALARKIFWGLFALSTLMILFFLFLLRIDIVQGATATISLFGVNEARTVDAARLIQRVYGAIATFLYTWGMFLAVFASSGLVPSILEPGRIELLLSKPVTRGQILLGRYLGNLLVVSLNICYLVAGVWLVLGTKTGIWTPNFLYSIATTIFLFAVLLTVIFFIGVLFESAALAVMVTVALMMMSPILAQNKVAEKLLSSQWSRDLWNGLYHVLPKAYDMGRMTLDLVYERRAADLGPVWSSAAFGLVLFVLSFLIFLRRDY